MSSTATVNGSYSPLEVQATESEVRTENVAIETDTWTCTADTALFNRETGQLVLTGNVVIRTTDGTEFTTEEVVLKEKAKGSDT